MAQFTHDQAETFRLNVVEHFPQLDVDPRVLDVEIGGEYQYSFFSIWSDGKKFTSNFSNEDSWNNFLSVCQYIASAIADNQQNEEVDRYHDPNWDGIHVNYPSSVDNQQSDWTTKHTCKNCGMVYNALYDGLCEDCYDATPLSEEHEIG